MNDYEKKIIGLVVEKGEDEFGDGSSIRVCLWDLDGVCNLGGHTDILSVVACKDLKGNDSISFQVNTPNDDSTYWASASELTEEIRERIFEELRDLKPFSD